MTVTRQEKIKELQQRLSRLQAEQRAAEQRARAAASKAERAKHTRKMVLIGGTMQAMIRCGEWQEAELLSIMNRYLTRADDRSCFGLPPLASHATPSSSVAGASAARTALGAGGGAA